MGIYGEHMGWGVAPAERFHVLGAARKRARENRWRATGRARVVHPTRGAVVVPCSSKLTAMMNAAEVCFHWWMEDGVLPGQLEIFGSGNEEEVTTYEATSNHEVEGHHEREKVH